MVPTLERCFRAASGWLGWEMTSMDAATEALKPKNRRYSVTDKEGLELEACFTGGCNAGFSD